MGKQIHILSDIDPETRTAICAKCGPVRIKRFGKSNGWRCKIAFKKYYRGKNEGTSIYREFIGERCERCGFVPEHVVQLDIHHLDYNHKNNDPSNLQTLCANCHRLITFQENFPSKDQRIPGKQNLQLALPLDSKPKNEH